MARYIVGRGTLLNTATVAVGAGIGLLGGTFIPATYQGIVISGIGLCCLGIGVKMFFASRNVLIVISAIVLGGILGLALGLHNGLLHFAAWARDVFGAHRSGTFTEAVITTSVLFCVGPMTLLGCMQDALEDKIELIAIKSLMDGFGAIFFAAALGPGVLVTAGIVFVVQGILTMAASPLKKLLPDERTLAEATAVGGVMMVAIGLGLLEIRQTPVATYLPALLLAPLISSIVRRWEPKQEAAAE